MLSERRCATMIPASDADRAKKWYGEMLGIQPTREDPSGIEFRCGEGTTFFVYPSQFAGTGQQTVMGWSTSAIEADMAELRERGVTFESYDMPELKTDDRGIAQLGDERGAWFKDSEGNILALFETSR